MDAAASARRDEQGGSSRERIQAREDGRRLARLSAIGEGGPLRTAKACGPDASWLASSPAEAKPAQPGGSAIIRGATVTNKS